MRKLIILFALTGVGLASPSVASGAATLTLSGTCVRDAQFPGLPVIVDSLYEIDAAATGLQPNSRYVLRVTHSPVPGISFVARETDATGAFSGPFGAVGFLAHNAPPSLTFTGTVWLALDRDLDLDPDETVAATDSVTITCPPRCADLIPHAQASGALSHGEARSLTAKDDSADASIASGKTRPARNKLKAFIHEVRAMLHSRRISSGLGQQLIDCANAKIASLP
jgi:hypothetical protein